MRQYHKVRIKDILRQTDKAVEIIFDLKNGLKETFRYKPGQFISLKTMIGGEDIRRSYSICSAPFENDLSIAVKEVEDGKFSTFANRLLKAGDELELFPPEGKFSIDIHPASKKNYVFFAAGSGITPVISNIKAVLREEPASRVMLFYSNSYTKDIIFKEELEGLKNKYFERFSINYLLSREALESPLFSGRISGEKCEFISKVMPHFLKADGFYICGPEEMILQISNFLQSKDIPLGKIHFELFGVPGSFQSHQAKQEKSQTEPADAKVGVTLAGLKTTIDFSASDGNILDAALMQGLDLPYACKGGVCSTCKAKVTKGDVKMNVNYALEPDEIENKIVLTCQSHPVTSEVDIDFDIAV